MPTQVETHAQDQPASGLALEQAVAIAEGTVRQREIAQLAALAVQRGQAGKHILDLHPVGTDVLHRRGAHGAGDQAEVLQAAQALLQRPEHEGMPGLTRLGLDQNGLAVIAQHPPAQQRHAQHQGVLVAGQQQVAAAADRAQRPAVARSQRQRLAHLGFVTRLGEMRGARRHTEAVVGL